jgi:hypothetical protein
LVKAIDKAVAENKEKRLAAFVVLLAANDEANRKKLTDLAEKEQVAIPLVLPADGAKGPESYSLNQDAEVTVLVTKANKVEANVVLTKPAPEGAEAQEAEVKQILEAAKKVIE